MKTSVSNRGVGRRLRSGARLGLVVGVALLTVGSWASAGDWIDSQRMNFKNQNRFRQVEDAIGKGDYQTARGHLQDILERDPGNLNARRMLLDLYQTQEEWTAALALCRSLLADQPDDFKIRVRMGFAALRVEEYALAVESFEQVLKAAPPGTDLGLVRANLAALYVKKGMLEEARTQGELLLGEADTVAHRRFLADVAVKQQRWEKALAHLDRIVERRDFSLDDDLYPEVHLARAYAAEQAGAMSVATQSYAAVVAVAGEKDARLPKALSGLMNLHYAAEAYADALAVATRLYRLSPSVETLLVIAECRAHREEWPEALVALQAAERLAVTPLQRASVLTRVGNVDFALEAYEEAEEALAEASRLLAGTEGVAPLLLQQAQIAMRRGRPAEAVTRYQQYLASADPFPEAAASSLLEALKQARQFEAGFVKGQALLAVEGVSASFQLTCLKYLLDFSRELGRQEDVYALARELVNRERQETLHMLQAARSAEKLQRFTDAAEMYERFLDQELDPQVALDYHYMLKRQGKSQASEVLLLSLLAKPGITASTEHEVRYELSQLYRASGRNQEYEAQLRALVRDTDEARFWRELADELYGSGRHEMAAEAFAKSIAEGQPPAESARTARVIAGIHLTLEDPATAAEWLAKSKAWVPPDDDWRLLKARSDYHLGNFGAAAATLLDIEQKSDVTFFYIGFAYYRDGKSGLAYHYLAKVSDDQNLPVNSRKLLLANRAFLAFDQGRFEEAMEDARMAIALEPSGSLELLQLKAMLELERYEEAHARSIEFLRRSPLSRLLTEDTAEPLATVEVAEPAGSGLRAFELFEEQNHWLETPANLSAVAQIAAVSAFRLGDTDLAIHLMSGAIEVEPSRHAPRYLRALGYHSRGDYQLALDDFQACLELDPDPRVSFWRDYAVTMGRLRRYREGTEALGRVLPLYPCSIDDLEETGYQYMTWGHNADSREHFAKAIDLYSEVLPYLDDDEALEYRRGRLAMKREYTKLDKTIGLQAYFTRTDYDLEGPVPTPSIDGALPSQTGVELSWRPPVIGFHNERLFEVFGRLLSNFEDDSWKFDEESYQGGVGIRGKPFKRLNLGVSFERLFKIGDNSEDNWLLRLLGGRAWGEFHEERFALGTAGQLYGDVGAFLDDPERWYYYLDGRVGLSVGAGSRVALTIPQLLMVRRWEEDSESGIDNYWLAGVGLTGRLFGGERRYTSGRWYIDTYLHYTWGRFDEVPAGLTEDERDFEGVVLGINFIK